MSHSLYRDHYFPDGTFSHIEKLSPDAPLPVTKRIVAKLPPPTTNLIVPYIDTVHNRIPIEIMRGCTRGCRFCQAGMITRPVRERSVEEIVSAIETGLRNTGFEEVGLLSLSSSDYTHILELVKAVGERFSPQAFVDFFAIFTHRIILRRADGSAQGYTPEWFYISA